MTKIETRGDVMVIEQRSWFLPGVGIFFVALSALNVLAAFIGPHAQPAKLIAPAIFCGLIGIFYAVIPGRRTATAEKAGSVSMETRTLFGSSRRVEEKAKSVDVIVGTYSASVNLAFVDGPPARVLVALKAWTWKREAPELRRKAAEIAGFLGIPLA